MAYDFVDIDLCVLCAYPSFLSHVQAAIMPVLPALRWFVAVFSGFLFLKTKSK